MLPSNNLHAGEIRVGLIGLDTSHVSAFLQIFNDAGSNDHVAGAQIVAAFKGGSADVASSRSRVDEFTRQAGEKFGLKLYDAIEDLARDVEAIMILSVDGRPHLEQFRRTLAAHKPVFIDKPLAGSLRDVLALAQLAKDSGVPCFSTSSLRYTEDSPAHNLGQIGKVTAAYSYGPAEYEPHHPDLYWYGIHAIEALYTVLGTGCLSVVRTHTTEADVVTGVWSDGRVGTMHGYRAGKYGYGVVVLGTKGSLIGGQKHSYRPLALDIVRFFQTGNAPVPLDTTVEICAFMEAADESKRRGGVPVPLAEVMRAAAANR